MTIIKNQLASIASISRRRFIKILSVLGIGGFIFPKGLFASSKDIRGRKASQSKSDGEENSLGAEHKGKSRVFIVKGGSPEKNIHEALEMLGGIERYIKPMDIVVLKPNAQWWNQGTTNTNAMKGFIDLVLNTPGFKGEVIIAENHHYKHENSRGWVTDQRNGDYNLNELIKYFNKQGFNNVTKYHWRDGGPNPDPRQGNAGDSGIVNSVKDGDGYVWLKDAVYLSKENRRCMMTYPIFTSAFSGKIIDLKNGVFHNGKFQDNLKLINFSCLNHHSTEFGVTGSIKNLMGIVDMTCGHQGTKPEGYYNVHYVGKESSMHKLGGKLMSYGRRLHLGTGVGQFVKSNGTFNGHYTGGALGYWMKNIRMPDLHILAAEYVGWGGRTSIQKRKRIKTVAVSKDPVALDYIGAKKLLLPATPETESIQRKLNDPDNPPFRLFLEECNHQGIGNLSEEKIEVIETILS